MKILNQLITNMKIDKKEFTHNAIKQEKNPEVSRYSHEEAKIKSMFDKYNQNLSKGKMGEIKAFIAKCDGNFESKMKTIESSLIKGVDITSDNLSAIHEALNGDIGELVEKLSSNPGDVKKIYLSLPKELKEAVDVKVKEGLSLREAISAVIQPVIKKMFIDNKGPNEVFNKEIGELNLDSVKPSSEFNTSGTIDVVKVFETAEREYKELNADKRSLQTDKPNNDKSTKIHVDFELEKDFEIIRTVESALEYVEEEIDKLINEIDSSVQVENLISFEPEHSFKKIIRTEITEKMIELKKEFKDYQKIINKQLDKIIIEKPVAIDMKESLNSVIDKLDKILMKSDITLYTDMKTERDLLSSSSKLENARVLIDNGNTKEAIEMIKEVKTLIASIEFKPSEQKVFGISQKMFFEKLYDQEIIRAMPIITESDPQLSPRSVLEILRGLGLNHESEVSELLNKEKSSDSVKFTQNMKTILMKLEEDATKRVHAKGGSGEGVKEGLDNLTGQQLMNKLEYKSQKQKLLFNMPIKIENSIKNLKIHVNAKKENQKIDWKNSTLYFVIHLNKLGDTGILVDVNNGQVNLTVKNDTSDIEAKMKPILDSAMTRFESVGFTGLSAHFERLTSKLKDVEKKPIDVSNKKGLKEGFDVKI